MHKLHMDITNAGLTVDHGPEVATLQLNFDIFLFQAVYDMLEFGGGKVRSSDLFGNLSAMSITKKFIKGLKVRGKFFFTPDTKIFFSSIVEHSSFNRIRRL